MMFLLTPSADAPHQERHEVDRSGKEMPGFQTILALRPVAVYRLRAHREMVWSVSRLQAGGRETLPGGVCLNNAQSRHGRRSPCQDDSPANQKEVVRHGTRVQWFTDPGARNHARKPPEFVVSDPMNPVKLDGLHVRDAGRAPGKRNNGSIAKLLKTNTRPPCSYGKGTVYYLSPSQMEPSLPTLLLVRQRA